MSRCLFARPVRLQWTPSTRCPCLFDELFESADVELINAADVDVVSQESVYAGEDWFQQIWRDHLDGRIPWEPYLIAVRDFLGSLRPRRALIEEVDAFATAHGIDRAVGLHIRQTDNVAEYKTLMANPSFDLGNVTKVEGFRLLIERSPEQTFFLATDNSFVQREFSKAYGSRIQRWPTRFSPWMRFLDRIQPKIGHRASSMSDALAEMLLLGRCRRIVGTYYSSFGEFAAIWGRCDFWTMQGSVPVPREDLNRLGAEPRALPVI